MKTIGQQIKWDFEASGDLRINDKNGKPIYLEDSDGDWAKYERDSEGNEIYYENSGGFWAKREWDSQGNVIYHQNSSGVIRDNRIPQIIEHNGHKYKLIK